jgi:hypothetical protein
MESQREQDSIFFQKKRIFDLVQRGAFGADVIAELLPKGQPHLFEKSMWDYKEKFPILPPNPTPLQTEAHNAEVYQIVKDVVAFYNSFGGYLIAGVKDNPREVVGFKGQFDIGDLAKRIKGATQHDIDCHYKLVEFEIAGKKLFLGVLQIPQRPDIIPPAQFRKNAPVSGTGKSAFKLDDFYLRSGDESRPAQTPEDYFFLCSPGRRTIANTVPLLPSILDNNLGPRDPSFVEFVGRESYLDLLWKWFCDRYRPAKLLSGMGGLGKTTIVREFAKTLLAPPRWVYKNSYG